MGLSIYLQIYLVYPCSIPFQAIVLQSSLKGKVCACALVMLCRYIHLHLQQIQVLESSNKGFQPLLFIPRPVKEPSLYCTARKLLFPLSSSSIMTVCMGSLSQTTIIIITEHLYKANFIYLFYNCTLLILERSKTQREALTQRSLHHSYYL